MLTDHDSDRDRYGPAEGWRWPAVHPYLVAIFPILATYAQNIDHTDPTELLLPLTLALPAAGALNFVLCSLLRSHERGALAASWTILLCYAYGPLLSINAYLAASRLPITLPASWALPLLAAMMLGGIYMLKRGADERESDDQYTLAANLAGSMALGVPLFTIGSTVIAIFWPAEITSPRTAYVPPTINLTATPDGPDIYYLIFHEYPDAATLARKTNFNNSQFIQRLRRRGFIVADGSKAGAPTARAVLASALTLCPPEQLPESPRGQIDLLSRHDVGRLLRGIGYRYIHLGSQPDGLRANSQADENYQVSPLPTEFSESLLQLTVAGPWFSSTGFRTQIAQKVERVKVLADEQGRKLVIAHFVMPGPPYRFERDGSVLSASNSSQRTPTENYLNQLLYTNSLIERMIDTVLLKSPKKPIIVIQSDAGMPHLVKEGEVEPADEEGILTAIYLPKKELRSKVPRDLSPANTFRFLLKEIFHAPIELLPASTDTKQSPGMTSQAMLE